MTSRTQSTFAPPVMEARRWLDGVTFPANRPLLNVSQAAPVDPPPAPMRAAMADMMEDPDAHLYGAVLGHGGLREEIAAQWSRAYGGAISPAQVAITAGCNQAFTATLAALCGEGDTVILPTPYYFNHRMALDMAGIAHQPLPVGDDMLPDVDQAAALITPQTRAIALVSPNNPAGVEYPAALLEAFIELAQRHGIRLILDETYRDFHSLGDGPHPLFQNPDWADTLIHLYSFSKAFRLTGHRVGAIIASEAFLSEVEKYLDTVTICPPQIGQMAALWGLQNLGDWLAKERAEILARGAAAREHLADIPGWQLKSAGAYFAYLTHDDPIGGSDHAARLVRERGVLILPGTMFRPEDGQNEARIAFANVDADGIRDLARRLS